MKKKLALCAVGALMALSVCLFGCSGGGSAAEEPQANIAPSQINPGERTDLNPGSDVSGTSDMWYVDGDQSKGGLYLRHSAFDGSVFVVVFVDADGKQVECAYNSEADNHLASAEDSEVAYDLIFDDPFNCYDLVSGTHYVRGTQSYDEVYAAFAGKTFANDDFEFTFNEDGTFTQAKVGSDSDPLEGKWAIQTEYLWSDVADPDWTYEYDYTVENGKITYIG